LRNGLIKHTSLEARATAEAAKDNGSAATSVKIKKRIVLRFETALGERYLGCLVVYG